MKRLFCAPSDHVSLTDAITFPECLSVVPVAQRTLETVVLLSECLQTDLLSFLLTSLSGNIPENWRFVKFFDVRGSGRWRRSCSNSLRSTHPYAGTLSANSLDHRTSLFRLRSSPECSCKSNSTGTLSFTEAIYFRHNVQLSAILLTQSKYERYTFFLPGHSLHVLLLNPTFFRFFLCTRAWNSIMVFAFN